MSPSHTSSKKHTVEPLPTLKYLLLKKSCLTRIKLFQKGESGLNLGKRFIFEVLVATNMVLDTSVLVATNTDRMYTN
jgi:hypothetical protein